MSCGLYEVGSHVEATSDFQIRDSLAAPVAGNVHDLPSGDAGEVKQKRIAGNFHWLIIRWDRLFRTLNLDPTQFELVRLISE